MSINFLTNCQFFIFQVIYEDLPSNLCAIRDFVEEREAAGNEPPKYPDRLADPVSDRVHVTESKPVKQVSTTDVLAAPLRQRPKVPGLQRDIEVLKAELMSFISRYGQDGFMPMRKQLRMHGRVDIEKAITRMGGFRKIANLMNLSLAYKHRKPSGYWDNLENLQEEVMISWTRQSSLLQLLHCPIFAVCLFNFVLEIRIYIIAISFLEDYVKMTHFIIPFAGPNHFYFSFWHQSKRMHISHVCFSRVEGT